MRYTFKAKVKEFNMTSPWVYVELPKKIEKEVLVWKKKHMPKANGWKFVPITVSIRTTEWKTSILPLGRGAGYFIALKAPIRKKEDIAVGDTVSISFVL